MSRSISQISGALARLTPGLEVRLGEAESLGRWWMGL